MTSAKFETYGLEVTNLNQQQYDMFCDRLKVGGLRDEYRRLTFDESGRRQFLTQALSQTAKDKINQQETLVGAQLAERFRDSLRDIVIEEGYESLIDLERLNEVLGLGWTFSEIPYHSACGGWAGKTRLMWVRKGLGRSLVALTNDLLSCDYSLHFEDAFRPTGVQEGLFRRRYVMAHEAQPFWSNEDCLLEAQSKTAFTPRFAAHKAGAAVDVRIRDLKNGQLLEIGHDYPDGGETVRLDSPYVTQEQWQNRKLLYVVAQRAGLVMYPFEDWHVSMNDVTAAVVQGRGARKVTYGPIKEFDRKSGSITHAYDLNELDEVFDVL
ncbi:hypothetical protein EOL96_00565 [Candidatus Saccharibacteria bacterium]|nr:hypothetical protein [Candidatus Saccharibacteria bacterium]